MLLRFLLLALPLTPVPAYALPALITNGIAGCDFQTGQLTVYCIPNFIAHVIQIVFSLLGLFFLLNVMFAGYEIAMGSATGSGKEAGIRRLQWAIIGFSVSVCAFLIIDFIATILLTAP